jgi:hypothetical protein
MVSLAALARLGPVPTTSCAVSAAGVSVWLDPCHDKLGGSVSVVGKTDERFVADL